MNKPLIAILTTVFLDAAGLGIIFPILPSLLKDISHLDNIAIYMGIIATIYAVMQFIFSPLLGILSDKIGRRAALLLSLGSATISYLLMSIADTLPQLITGRIIAGIAGASMPVAMAYLTDISLPEKRAKYFGLFNAMFGIGLVFGPVLGGILGEYHIRFPFLMTAFLNACNFIWVLAVLPSSHQINTDSPKHPKELSATRLSLRQFLSNSKILPIAGTFFILSFAGEACAICWAMWGYDSFQWDGFHVGLSLAAFGLFQSLAQIFLPGPAAKLLGERRAAIIGIIALCCALCFMALITKGWMVFAIIPIFALGSISAPSLQVIATKSVNSQQQGQLQGILSSALSLSSIIAPLFFSTLYSITRDHWTGAVWLVAAIINIIAIPLILYGLKKVPQHKLA